MASCNGTGTITVPANTNTTTNVVYTVTLTALGVAGTPAANAEVTITVPAAPPPPVAASPPTISGVATKGQTLTESHGSWSNGPSGYSYQWQRCNNSGSSCQAIVGATAQTYKLAAADVGHTLTVQETASNVSGAGSPATSSATAVVHASPAGGKKPHKAAPNTRLVFEQISSKRHSATFRFKATGKSTGFRCALVRRPTRKGAKTPAPKYSACRSPKTFKHLKPGSYVLRVRAVGPGGVDKTPATYRFKIK
jgi:PKD repeat protein